MSRKFQYMIAIILLITSLGFGLLLGAATWIIRDTPDISHYDGAKETTFIFSSEGKVLNEFFTENRIYVTLDDIPEDLQKAIIAIEDRNFFEHSGIDAWGIGRAILANIREGYLAQGGSTITQQLARNALLSLQKTFYRKIQEFYLALQFEHLYTKQEILEMYLNEIFMGHNAYGVETAARQYFGKSVKELDLSESALIAALPRSPNYYSPFRRPEEAINRRNLVLDRMYDLGFISKEKAEEAKKQELNLRGSEPEEREIAPYFVHHARKELLNILSNIYSSDQANQMIYNGGLKVYTTLNVEMQEKANQVFENALESGYIPTIERKNETPDPEQPQFGLVSLEPETGAIKTMIGGRGNDEYNRATQARRQPGSAFKPFVYASALEQGYSPATVFNDMPLILDDGHNNSYAPRNFQNNYQGFVTMRTALAQSINIASVKQAQEIGHSNIVNHAKNLGITFDEEDYRKTQYSLALGGMTRGVSPLEMAQAYAVFANEGIRTTPYTIEKIVDKRDNVIYEANHRKDIVMEKDSSYLLTDMLKSVIQEGTGRRANLNRPVAGKTGTTNENTDAWFVGYTPDLVTSVWIGEDKSKRSMHYDQKDEDGNYLFPESDYRGYKVISSGEAAQLWKNYMEKVIEDKPITDFSRPDNIISKEVDPITGLLPNNYTPKTITEFFREDNIPQNKSNFYGPLETIEICEDSNLKATSKCPEDTLIVKTYIKDSGIIINMEDTLTKTIAENNNELFENQNRERKIQGTYIIEEGHPIQKIDEDTGLPLITIENKEHFVKKPEEICDVHADPDEYEEERKEDNIFDRIRDLF